MPQKRKTAQTPSRPVLMRTSEMVAAVRPNIVEFIRGLGYPKEKAAAFADGYLAAASKLPLIGKLRALSQQDDHCMTAGFRAADISEQEALERHNKK